MNAPRGAQTHERALDSLPKGCPRQVWPFALGVGNESGGIGRTKTGKHLLEQACLLRDRGLFFGRWARIAPLVHRWRIDVLAAPPLLAAERADLVGCDPQDPGKSFAGAVKLIAASEDPQQGVLCRLLSIR